MGYAYNLLLGLWNEVFLGCNLCLFILLPFAYFFTESAGFSGSRKVIPLPISLSLSLSLSHSLSPVSPSYFIHYAPIAYLQGLMSRVYETILLLSMLGVMATVLAGLLSSIFSRENTEVHVRHTYSCTCTCMFHAIKYLFIPIRTDVTMNIICWQGC